METEERRIIFVRGDNEVLCDLPLNAYETGDIKETKEILAKELNCGPEEIEVRITGVRDSRLDKGNTLKNSLIDAKAIRDFIKHNS